MNTPNVNLSSLLQWRIRENYCRDRHIYWLMSVMRGRRSTKSSVKRLARSLFEPIVIEDSKNEWVKARLEPKTLCATLIVEF